MDTENKFEAINLSCIRQHNTIFANLSFQLTKGQGLLIEGANGSGKSSLLRLLSGLSTPSTGEIRWQEQAIQSISIEYVEKLHYIGHANGIKLGLTVEENLRLASYLSRQTSHDHDGVLSLLQLANHKFTQANYLSAGQKRRLALAKLFLFPKPLWILDEPFTALDANTQTLFLSHLEQHLKKGGMSIISSHHPINIDAAMQTLRLEEC